MRRRATMSLLAVAGLAATTLVANPLMAEEDPPTPEGVRMEKSLEAAQSDLETPFETSDGAEWTSVVEARQFNRRLANSSDRVRVQNVGRSGEGRPIQLVSVGYPEPQSQKDAADGSVALFNCSIHGNEPAGREGCLQLARDMAETEDPAWKRLLSSTTVLFTNINPDGWEANTRGNADGVDVNRDFMGLETPEARALARVMGDWKPDVLNDLHEYGPSTYYKDHVLQLWPRNRNVDPAIHDLGQRMVEDYSAPQVETNPGYTAGIYGEWKKDGEPFLQIAGDGQARILRNYAGLQNLTGILTETATRALNDEEAADDSLRNRRRVQVEYSSAIGTMQMVLENRNELAEESAAAAERVTAKGADRSGVVYFGGQDNMLPTSRDEVEPSPMCGYQLSSDQFSDLRRTLRLHGISWDRNADGAYISMAQPDQPLIPLLLDERYEYALTAATPVDDC